LGAYRLILDSRFYRSPGNIHRDITNPAVSCGAVSNLDLTPSAWLWLDTAPLAVQQAFRAGVLPWTLASG
jgi:hypothetical protein